MSREDLSLSEARRIALAAQGFDRPRPNRRVSARDLATSIRRIGLLQIDCVNVMAPAHYQVLFSQLGPYERPILDELVYKGREFTKQWSREASIVPVEKFASCCGWLLAPVVSPPPRIWPIITAYRCGRRVLALVSWWNRASCVKYGWGDGARRLISTGRRGCPGNLLPQLSCRRSTRWSGTGRARSDS
jgi:hypothetical protein